MGLWEWLRGKRNAPARPAAVGRPRNLATRLAPETAATPAVRHAPAVGKPATGEQTVAAALRGLEDRLKAAPDKSLPIVSIRVEEILGRQRISCHFATGYNSKLDTDAAKRALSETLAAHGFNITGGGDYMSDRHENRYHFWDYDIRRDDDPYEREVKQFDTLRRDPAVAKAHQLLADGQIDLLVAWLRSGEYYGIPAEVLHTCNRDDAAAAIIPLLKDPSPDVRTRAATALGPLGGVEAAKALCAALPGANERQEYWRMAGALGRLAWPGAAPALTQAILDARESTVRAALADALVRCGDVSNGLNILYAGFSDDHGSNDYGSKLDDLDRDGIRDARLISEFIALVDRTENTNTRSIAMRVIGRHKHEWEEIRKSVGIRYIRGAPTKRYQGEVICPIDRASAITGIPVDELHKLIRTRHVDGGRFSDPHGYWFVRLDGNVPCGELLDDPDPGARAIGAKQEGD